MAVDICFFGYSAFNNVIGPMPKVGILATEVEGAEVPSHQPEAEHSPLDME